MGNVLPNEVKQLVDGPNFAHLATIMSDGSPHSAPVWIGREGDPRTKGPRHEEQEPSMSEKLTHADKRLGQFSSEES
jgi:hypothetical protein